MLGKFGPCRTCFHVSTTSCTEVIDFEVLCFCPAAAAAAVTCGILLYMPAVGCNLQISDLTLTRLDRVVLPVLAQGRASAVIDHGHVPTRCVTHGVRAGSSRCITVTRA